MRYPMRLGAIVGPALALFGGTRARSFVELSATSIRFKFGWLFDRTFPLAVVAGGQPHPWPLWFGIGWRVGPGGRIGLIGTRAGVVDVRFKQAQPFRVAFVRWRSPAISVSLDDPDRFLADLRAALSTVATAG